MKQDFKKDRKRYIQDVSTDFLRNIMQEKDGSFDEEQYRMWKAHAKY